MVIVAAIVVTVAQANGGYGLTARTLLAAGVWSVVIIGLAFGLLPQRTPTRAALAAPALLGLFGLWTLASMLWAASPEGAFTEFNRVSLYTGLLVLAVLAASDRNTGRCADGLTLGIVVTALIALSGRFFPDLFLRSRLAVGLPYGESRLSFPIGYWNALGVFVSLGIPLCLRVAVVARTRVVRALATSALPVLGAAIYLTSSRGAIVTALVGGGLCLVATARRWRALAAAVVGATGAALAVGLVSQRHTLVNGPLTSSLAESQGRIAAVLVLGCCLIAGMIFMAGEALLAGRRVTSPLLGWALVAVAGAAVVVVVVASHPIARFDAFKQLPVPASRPGSANFANSHLLSGSGSGRWQFWAAAYGEFKSAPLQGGGAGSYESWWDRHASFAYVLKNAHSLYFEVLGELGIVGLLLLLGSFLAGLTAAFSRWRDVLGERRVTIAALTAVFAAFLAGAAIDWIWQFAAIAGIAVVSIGLAGSGSDGTISDSRSRRREGRVGSGIAVILVAWVLICAQAIPWLAAGKISDSQAAVRRGDANEALMNALDAKTLQPWAASPYVQLALVAEYRREFGASRRFITSAISRDSNDWRVWYLAARIERESGRHAAAARSAARARSLDPRSPLFSAAP